MPVRTISLYERQRRAQISKYRRLMRDRVTRGARLLDKEQPGWENKIDIRQFDIESPYNCILGQVFVNGMNGTLRTYETSGYSKGLIALGMVKTYDESGYEDADEEAGARHGFSIGDYDIDVHDANVWEWLATYWIREIQKRRGS